VKKLLFLVVILLSLKIFPETYPGYRQDDLLYVNYGKKNMEYQSRNQTGDLPTNKINITNNTYLYNLNFISGKFNSQRGGLAEGMVSQYSSKAGVSTELGIVRKEQNVSFFVTAGISQNYQEKYQLKKSISKAQVLEFIGGFDFTSNSFKTGVQFGKGFQRLDSYGILFSGQSNFTETFLHLSSLKTKLSSFYIFPIMNNEIPKYDTRLIGGSIDSKFISGFNTIKFIFFSYLEQQMLSEKQEIYFIRKDYESRGDFRYAGLELETNKILNTYFEAGAFRVTGKRIHTNPLSTGNYPFFKTDGRLYYLQLINSFAFWKFSMGGLFSRKDNGKRNDTQSNGFSGVSSDLRIFGGNSSFLLTANLNNGEIGPFSDDLNDRPVYENRGIRLFNTSAGYNFWNKLRLNFLFNRAWGVFGKGLEGIVQGIYFIDAGVYNAFILISYCKAHVTRDDIIPIFNNTIGVKKPDSDYDKIYFSANIVF
jgi:hypothetical protein